MNKKQKENARHKKEDAKKTIKWLRGKHLDDMHKIEELKGALIETQAAYQLSMDLVLTQVCKTYGEAGEDGTFTIAIPVPNREELMQIKAAKDEENGTYVIKAIPPKKVQKQEEKAE